MICWLDKSSTWWMTLDSGFELLRRGDNDHHHHQLNSPKSAVADNETANERSLKLSSAVSLLQQYYFYNDSYNNCAMAKLYYYKRPPLIEPHLQNFCSDLQQHRQCWDRNNLLDHCFVSFYKTWLLLRPFDCIESRNLATLCSPRHALLIVIAPLWLHDMTLLPSVATIQQKIEWIQVPTARKKVCYLNH